MAAYKVVGRYKEKEFQESWCRGKPHTQAKKRVYVDEVDFLKYSPDLIKRWKRMYYIEVYNKINSEWTILDTVI